ncbi:MAG: tyrosine--tRNA ligase [Candidatus Pacebacteria bacterium]|nr:tyrosine--tRNA ligase [Candidatus Paceibacterota bacterium]
MAKLSEILKERGYAHQFSSETLEEITDTDNRTVYLGVDPTADSIHLGNFVQYMFLRRFAEAGHKIILIIGGGTALAGDPKPDVERSLTDASVVAERAARLKAQAQKILGGVELTLVNNADWLTKLNLMEFLRDTGKHFTVNSLIKKEAISARLESTDGISFTEFSYPLLQAYDFWHLYKEYGCDVQIGGSDQWGNIIAGVDLIRRKEGAKVYALSSPLIIEKSTGKKFGKSEGNAIWLDSEKTTEYEFYQFFLNVADDMTEELMLKMTLLPKEEIDSIMAAHHADPGHRTAQKELARAVTALVHGDEAAERAERVSVMLFGSETPTSEDWNIIAQTAPSQSVNEGSAILDVLVESRLASSKREAREYISGNAITLNGTTVSQDRPLNVSDFQNGHALLKRGKRSVAVIRLQ